MRFCFGELCKLVARCSKTAKVNKIVQAATTAILICSGVRLNARIALHVPMIKVQDIFAISTRRCA